jgi:hypothetical protein
MGFLTNLRRNRFRRKAWSDAYDLRKSGDLVGAAKVCEQLAADSLTFNELIYARDCHDAFQDWLKAGEVAKALTNARNALKLIANSTWFPDDDIVQDICGMVGELYTAGYTEDADEFACEIDAEYVKHGYQSKFKSKHGNFPITCPQCGAVLPQAENETTITCPFCNSVIHSD